LFLETSIQSNPLLAGAFVAPDSARNPVPGARRSAPAHSIGSMRGISVFICVHR